MYGNGPQQISQWWVGNLYTTWLLTTPTTDIPTPLMVTRQHTIIILHPSNKGVSRLTKARQIKASVLSSGGIDRTSDRPQPHIFSFLKVKDQRYRSSSLHAISNLITKNCYLWCINRSVVSIATIAPSLLFIRFNTKEGVPQHIFIG